MRHLPTEILAAKDFAQSEGKADREQTRWRSGMNSNFRYHGWNVLNLFRVRAKLRICAGCGHFSSASSLWSSAS